MNKKVCKFDCTEEYYNGDCQNCQNYFLQITLECDLGGCECGEDHLTIGFCNMNCAIEYLGQEIAEREFKEEEDD